MRRRVGGHRADVRVSRGPSGAAGMLRAVAETPERRWLPSWEEFPSDAADRWRAVADAIEAGTVDELNAGGKTHLIPVPPGYDAVVSGLGGVLMLLPSGNPDPEAG